MQMRRGQSMRLHAARVRWFKVHPDRLSGLPGIHEDVTDEARVALDRLRVELSALELLGHTTPLVQRDTIRRLVSEFKKDQRF
jgi:hypothetical protein